MANCANLIRFMKPICPRGWLQNCWDNIWYLRAKAVVFQFFHASLLWKGPDSHHFIIFPHFYRQPEGMLDPLFVWIHSLVNYVFWATTCTWTFSLSRFCNIKIGCATLTKKQQIFLKCNFLFLYAFVFPGAVSSMEQKYQKARMRENKEKHKTSPYKALLTINFLQKQGSWRQDHHHLMVATWVM